VRLLLVDDHAVVREGLERMLARCDDLRVVGVAECGREAITLATQLAPDVVLLDLSLPDLHGLEVLARLRAGEKPPRVLVLTVHDDDEVVLDAVRAGADGYVLKTARRDELLAAIRKVAGGGKSFDAVVVAALMRNQKSSQPAVTLTMRELDVLRLVAEGLTNREIGSRLFLSADTVNGHLDSIYRKLGVSDRAHAVAVALRRGLIS
jgi:DNA-binding NarL/FixJ family response regulator